MGSQPGRQERQLIWSLGKEASHQQQSDRVPSEEQYEWYPESEAPCPAELHFEKFLGGAGTRPTVSG